MDDWLTLVVPPGAEDAPISHGTREFKWYRANHLDPNSMLLVRMPPDVASYYLRGNTGFYLMPEQKDAPPPAVEQPKDVEAPMVCDGPEMVRMRHPDGGSIGWGQTLYEPDEHGVVTLPNAAVPDAMSHGFKLVPPGEEDDADDADDADDDDTDESEVPNPPHPRKRGRPRKA